MCQSPYPWFPALTHDLSAQVSRISPRLSRPAWNHADILPFSSQSIGQLSSPDSPIAPRSSQSHRGPGFLSPHTPASQLQRVRSLTIALPPPKGTAVKRTFPAAFLLPSHISEFLIHILR